jgi:hypothetical protein
MGQRSLFLQEVIENPPGKGKNLSFPTGERKANNWEK